MNPTRRGLALFDFDGTITDRDSFVDFLRWSLPGPQLLAGLLRCLPAVLGWKLGLLSRQAGKERVMAQFWGGLPLGDFERRCIDYATARIPELVRPGAMAAIENHRARGDRILVISASPENWIAPWCAAHGLELLATPLVVENGHITGRIDGRNCHGPEKVARLDGFLDRSDYGPVSAYGDSSGDREMLAIADHAHYRPFRDR